MKKATLLISAVLLTAAGCSNSEHPSPRNEVLPVVEVKTAEVTAGEHKNFQEVMGTVEAKLRAQIEAKTSGRIEALPVHLGQKVKTGDLLVQLNASEIQARVDQAVATREQASTELKRLKALLEQQALTQAEFDAAQARFRVADAALREAETLLGYGKVVAPFDGVVVRKLADVGDLAGPGKPLLELEDPSALRFAANVPDALISSIQIGMEIPLQLGSRQVSARVAEIAPTGDPVSRTSRVELDLPGSDLRSGAFGRLLVPAGDQSLLVVPSDSLVDRGQLETVFVVKSNRAELRLVRTGKRIGKSIEILSGVSAGEKVVTENAAALRDGQPVTLR